MSLGIRKNGRYNHLIRLLDEKKIKYNPKEIMELSTMQMTRKIIELGGKMRIEPRQRAGEESFGRKRCSKCDFTCQSNNQLIKHNIEVHKARYSVNKLKQMHFWSKYHQKPLNDTTDKESDYMMSKNHYKVCMHQFKPENDWGDGEGSRRCIKYGYVEMFVNGS